MSSDSALTLASGRSAAVRKLPPPAARVVETLWPAPFAACPETGPCQRSLAGASTSRLQGITVGLIGDLLLSHGEGIGGAGLQRRPLVHAQPRERGRVRRPVALPDLARAPDACAALRGDHHLVREGALRVDLASPGERVIWWFQKSVVLHGIDPLAAILVTPETI